MLLAKVKTTLRKYRMLSLGDRVTVAVSGGPDSVCLLSVLQFFAKDLDLSLHIAHLDHMFRGEESAAEARFVEALAKRVGIPATIEQFDVPSYCRERGLSVQAGAREVRYAFLARAAKETGSQRIALGHTASDQAETLLMRLLRGAGAQGLSGIPPVREHFIRPLIDATRDEILRYLHEQGLSFVTDSSNLKPDYTRNRVRHEIMPLLKSFNPRIEETLAAEADLLRDENDAMNAWLEAALSAVISREGDRVRTLRDRFNSLASGVKRRAIRLAVNLAGGDDAPGLSSVQTEEALDFIAQAQSGRAMKLPSGMILEREYGDIVIRRDGEAVAFCHPVVVPGSVTVPELSLEVETKIYDAGGEVQRWAGVLEKRGLSEENYLWQAVFDYDKIALPLYMRSRRPGDWFRPAGMAGGRKKLQDYFVDEKVPRAKRDTVPVLATDRDVVWVVGMRTDERFLPDEGTKKLLFVSFRRVE